MQRTPERDLLPMAQHLGIGVVPWAPLGGGVLTGKYTRGQGDIDSLRSSGNEARGRTNERNLKIARAVDAVADELGASSAQVATAWVMAQSYRTIPIVGARKVSQINDTLGAATLELSPAQLATLDEVSRPTLGFPHDFLAEDRVQDLVKSESRTRLVPMPVR